MNIQISDIWLREYLDTKATHQEIAKYLSLCGPSVEKVTKLGKDFIYDIEVTTNRVDSMSVYGIAREAAAVLPQFGIKANLKKLSLHTPKPPASSLKLSVRMDKKLVKRTIGVICDEIKNWKSPEWMKERLEASGLRSLNSIVDITNYVMMELGHPMHAFDYDKIPKSTIIIRESKKGEKIISLDDKEYILPGGDIIFQSTNGEIIDLPGIIGTKNSVVSPDTKRVLFFIDNNDPIRIRRTSMSLAIRTNAATLNEKNVDPELGLSAILRAIELAKSVSKAKVASKIYDTYPEPYKPKSVSVTHEFINKSLGTQLEKNKISSILQSLEFGPKWSGENLTASVPSHRANDIDIPEDIVEEVARIYGYHNLPSAIMSGKIPEPLFDTPFMFESKLKNLIKGLGGIEVYTLSLVPENTSDGDSLKLKNPLGDDTKNLRTTLRASLVEVANSNKGNADNFHIFEMANIYIPQKGRLPDEISIIAGIFSNYKYRDAKGIVEALIKELNLNADFIPEDSNHFQPSKRAVIKLNNVKSGEFGILDENYIYYEFRVETLRKFYNPYPSFKQIPKYPPQIEDITFILPERTRIGEVVDYLKSSDRKVANAQLKDVYKDSYTIRLWYQEPDKTMTDKEVESIRTQLLIKIKNKFGISQKE